VKSNEVSGIFIPVQPGDLEAIYLMLSDEGLDENGGGIREFLMRCVNDDDDEEEPRKPKSGSVMEYMMNHPDEVNMASQAVRQGVMSLFLKMKLKGNPKDRG